MKDIFYGPVFSRRFGYSLGVDLIPYKICSFDCIYCQLGKTTSKPTEIKKYRNINFEDFKAGLLQALKNAEKTDYITFAGSGEPTLSSDLKALLSITKEITNIPVVVLTNGSGFINDNVIEAVMPADIVKISLDAADEATFYRINKPHESISFDAFVAGIKKFFKIYTGKIFIEIMLLKNINDNEESLKNFQKLFAEIPCFYKKVKKVHLNNPLRLPEAYSLFKSSEEQMEKFMKLLPDKTEIIKISKSHGKAVNQLYEKDLLIKIQEIIKRRPSTSVDISRSLDININEAIKLLTYLIDKKKIYFEIKNKTKLFFLKRDKEEMV